MPGGEDAKRAINETLLKGRRSAHSNLPSSLHHSLCRSNPQSKILFSTFRIDSRGIVRLPPGRRRVTLPTSSPSHLLSFPTSAFRYSQSSVLTSQSFLSAFRIPTSEFQSFPLPTSHFPPSHLLSFRLPPTKKFYVDSEPIS